MLRQRTICSLGLEVANELKHRSVAARTAVLIGSESFTERANVWPNEQRLSDAEAMLEEGTAVHGVR
jgi:hypothetical protein